MSDQEEELVRRWLLEKLDPLLIAYLEAVVRYYESPQQPSYSEIEMPLIDIANWLVTFLGIVPKFQRQLSPEDAAEQLKLRKKIIPVVLRWEVWERDNFTCKHCGSRRDLSVDHIIAESKGGATELSNLQTLCRACNSRKGNR